MGVATCRRFDGPELDCQSKVPSVPCAALECPLNQWVPREVVDDEDCTVGAWRAVAGRSCDGSDGSHGGDGNEAVQTCRRAIRCTVYYSNDRPCAEGTAVGAAGRPVHQDVRVRADGNRVRLPAEEDRRRHGHRSVCLRRWRLGAARRRHGGEDAGARSDRRGLQHPGVFEATRCFEVEVRISAGRTGRVEPVHPTQVEYPQLPDAGGGRVFVGGVAGLRCYGANPDQCVRRRRGARLLSRTRANETTVSPGRADAAGSVR